MFGIAKKQTKRERLYLAMFQKDYIIVNDDTKTRIGYQGQVSSNLDLIFASRKLADKLSYQQLLDAWGSDHYPMVIYVEVSFLPYKKSTNQNTGCITNQNTSWIL